MGALKALGRRLAARVDGEYPVTAAELKPGMELSGWLELPVEGGDWVSLPAQVDAAEPVTDGGRPMVRVTWTVPYPAALYEPDHVLYVIAGGAR